MNIDPCDGTCMVEVRANATLRQMRDRLYRDGLQGYDWAERELRWEREVSRTLREAMRDG